MLKRDFHGWTLVDAETEIDVIVGDVRIRKVREQAEFITGRGVIRDSLLEKLKQYGLNAELQWGNDGVISVLIE